MSSFYGQLDLYKHLSTVDRKTLNGGGSWTRNFKLYSANVEKTAFNVTGLIQPTFVYEMLNLVPDADSLHNRQLLDFPPVQTASAIIHHFNHHKFIIVGLSNGESLFQATLSASFSVSWKTSNRTITPSEVSQKHLCEKVGQSHVLKQSSCLRRQS